MTNFNKIILALAALLISGAGAIQAQSVNITQSGNSISSYYCMPANSSGISFQAVVSNLNNGSTTGEVTQYTWTASGGIDISGGAGTSSVTVAPKTGTDYSNGYSKPEFD
ncbi:MAG: hypothetical protein LBU90_10995 [Bacteroidales bacterium]|jgi:hypothetical protein|nr:hypothetical protein [Bacteroidales bacterium]